MRFWKSSSEKYDRNADSPMFCAKDRSRGKSGGCRTEPAGSLLKKEDSVLLDQCLPCLFRDQEIQQEVFDGAQRHGDQHDVSAV